MEVFLFIILCLHIIHSILCDGVPPNIEGNWELKFKEEFDNLDPDVWELIQGNPPDAGIVPKRFSNNAPGLSYYKPSNVFVQNNKCVLRVNNERYVSPERTYPATGAKIKLKRPFRYGYMNIRAKLPFVIAGGIYHIGLVNSDNTESICIMETINEKQYYNHITKPGPQTTKWSWLFSATNGFTNADFFPYLQHDYNTFGVHWGFQNVTFYINDKPASWQVLSLDGGEYSLKNNEPYPMDNELNLVIYNGLGNWAGYPNDKTIYPYDIIIDKVELYQDSSFDRNLYGLDKEKDDKKEAKEKEKEDKKEAKEKEKEDKKENNEKIKEDKKGLLRVLYE